MLVKPEAMEGTGFLGQAAEDVYHLPDDDLYLVGTSEVPLAAYHMDEILDAASLPLRYAGWSTCFRREAGSYGKDTRGIIRVHQFDKVEMFSYCRPEDAQAEHRRLLAWEKEMLAKVEVPYRVIDVAAGDLGSSAARKFDCEAWVPTQGRYRELTSTSNCTDFQARRLNIRMRDERGTRPVATLNGTLATTRWLVAILENHQQPGRFGAGAEGAGALRRARGTRAVRRDSNLRRRERPPALPPSRRDRPRRHAGALGRHGLRAQPPSPRGGRGRRGAGRARHRRPPRWMGPVIEQTGHRGLAVCANGALVYDLHTETVVEEHLLEPEIAAAVVHALRDAVPGLAFAVERGERGFAHEPAYRPGWDSRRQARRRGGRHLA